MYFIDSIVSIYKIPEILFKKDQEDEKNLTEEWKLFHLYRHTKDYPTRKSGVEIIKIFQCLISIFSLKLVSKYKFYLKNFIIKYN